MKDTDFQILSKYEVELERAVKLGYARNMTNPSRVELAAVYQNLFKMQGLDLTNGCNTCLFNGLKRLGLAYFQEKEKRAKEEETKEPEEIVETQEDITETPEEIVHGDYGTIDGLPVPADDEALITPEPVSTTLDQVPPPELPEKAPRKSNNTKSTKKK